jgi:hypothetical protein
MIVCTIHRPIDVTGNPYTCIVFQIPCANTISYFSVAEGVTASTSLVSLSPSVDVKAR